jgi:hypothetical protein
VKQQLQIYPARNIQLTGIGDYAPLHLLFLLRQKRGFLWGRAEKQKTQSEDWAKCLILWGG